MSSDAARENWATLQREVVERLDASLREVLVVAGESNWGLACGKSWDVVVDLETATWQLFHLAGRDQSGGYRFHALSVTPTIDPRGQVVALQVSNGVEFLALTDVSGAGLLRGLQYLIRHKPLPEQNAPHPPFVPSAEGEPQNAENRGGWLRRLLGG